MSVALQLHTETMADWKLLCDQAAILVKTGFLPQSIKTPEQAVAIVLTGRELGIGMMAALNNINVIQGKPTVPPQLMLALISRTNQVEDIDVKTSEQGATCTIKRRGRSPFTARFGPAEAMKMGLSGKDNYKKQPATMYQWRAVAAACRVTFSDVLHGLYLPEEMGATVDAETGEVIEVIAHASEAAEDLQAHLMEQVIEAEADIDTAILRGREPEPVRNVKPKTLGDIVTPKQLWMIRGLLTEGGLDAEKECQARFGVPLEEISKRTASAWIEELKSDGEDVDREAAAGMGSRAFRQEEPVRTVKLEGAQPTDSKAQWPKAPGLVGQIFAKCQALNWTAANLADEIEKRFKMVVSEEAVINSLPDALTPQELKTLDQALAAEFNNRSRTR